MLENQNKPRPNSTIETKPKKQPFLDNIKLYHANYSGLFPYIERITKPLQSGKCPKGLAIDLGDNAIGAKGAKAVAKAIMTPAI